MPERIEWIDAIKGLGIILVILGHMTIPQIARLFIFSFHMPLFFFVSGWLFKNNFTKAWCLKKCDSLLIPYALYGIITIAVLHFAAGVPLNLLLERFLKGNGVGVLWFLVCLLVVEVIGGAIVRILEDNIGLLFITALGAAVMGWLVPKMVNSGIMCIKIVPAALAFWLAGHVAKAYTWERKISRWQQCVSVAVMVLTGMLFFVQRVDMAAARYGNVFIFYTTALSLVGLVFMLFCRLNVRTKPLTFLGQISLELMCLHGIVPVFLRMFVESKSLLRVLSLLILILLAYAIHRWIPLFSGQAVVFARLK